MVFHGGVNDIEPEAGAVGFCGFEQEVGIFAHPLFVVIPMHAGEGVEGIFLRRFAVQSADFKKSRAHKGKMSHSAIWRQHHGVGAGWDILCHLVGGALELFLRSARRRRPIFAALPPL